MSDRNKDSDGTEQPPMRMDGSQTEGDAGPLPSVQLSNDIHTDISKASACFVDSSFSSWAKLGPNAKIWKLCPHGKQPHLLAKQTMQLGDVCLRVQHATVSSAGRFKNTLVTCVEKFRAEIQVQLRTHPRIAGCRAYVAIERAAKQKRLVTFIFISLSDLKSPVSMWMSTVREAQQRASRLCGSWVGKSNVVVDLPHGVRLGVSATPALDSMLLMHTIMNCAGRVTAQAWIDAQASAAGAEHEDATIRESCVKLCKAALQREWEWVSLGKTPQRRPRCFPTKTSNFSMPGVTYADALSRPPTTHPPGASTKMGQGKPRQPSPQTERPVETPPCERPLSEQRHEADTILGMEKELQLLRERVASLETKFDEVLTILRRQEKQAQGPVATQQREETAIVASQRPMTAMEEWFSPRNCLTPKSKRAASHVPTAATAAGGDSATPSSAIVARDALAASPVTPPAKRQSQGTPKPP